MRWSQIGCERETEFRITGVPRQEFGNEGNWERGWKAIADFTEAIQLNPESASAYYGRALAYSEQLRFDKAITDLDIAIQLRPTDAQSFLARSSAYRNKGDIFKANADRDRAMELDPTVGNRLDWKRDE